MESKRFVGTVSKIREPPREDDNEFIGGSCKVRGVKLFLEYQCTVSVELEFLKLKSPGGGEKWKFDFWQNR